MQGLIQLVTMNYGKIRTDESFSVLEGKLNGLPLMAMIDMGLRGYKLKAQLPWFLSLTTNLSETTKDGQPTTKESTNLEEWEDLVEKRISTACQFVYVGRVTWNASRELLFYADSTEPISSVLEALSAEHMIRSFSFHCERDDKWERVSVYFK